MINKENLCHATGCPDLCCRSRGLDYPLIKMKKGSSRQFFPEAVEIPENEDLGDCPPGAYLVSYPLHEAILIQGVCPKSGASGCEGSKPQSCSNFSFGGNECNELRKKHGLYEIDEEGNQIQTESFFRECFKDNTFS